MITHAHVTERQGQATAKLAGLARVSRLLATHGADLPCDQLYIGMPSSSPRVDLQVSSWSMSWTERCALVDQLADYCEIPASDRSYYTHNGNAFYAAETNDWHIYTAGVADEDENPHPEREEEND